MARSGARYQSRRLVTPPLIGIGIMFALASFIVCATLLSLPPETPKVLFLLPAAGLVYAGAGLLAWSRRPANPTGMIICAGGALWLLIGAANTGPQLLMAVGDVLGSVPLAIVIHLVLAFPSGHLVDRASKITVGAAYFVSLVLQAPQYLYAVDSPLSIADRPDLVDFGWDIQTACGAVVMLATVIILVRRLRHYPPSQQRALAPLYTYAVLAAIFIPLSASLGRNLLGGDVMALFAIQLSVLMLVPIAFVLALLRGGFTRAGVLEDLATWLGSTSDTGTAQPAVATALGDALGDPTVELYVWSETADEYLDSNGSRFDPATLQPPQDSSAIESGGRPMGMIVYDSSLLSDPEEVARAGRVVAIALDQMRLSNDLVASREAVRQSRARIVAAADEERRRIARDLHDGLQARLVLLAMQVDAMSANGGGDGPDPVPVPRTDLDHMQSGLVESVDDLRALVDGVMPAALLERGLEAATRGLADRIVLPVDIEFDGIDGRLPPLVESCGYFVISETLTNSIKHADATRLHVRVDRQRNRSDGLADADAGAGTSTEATLRLEVGDNGKGGALTSGTGVRSIADRVDVLGGSFTISSPVGSGTTVTVELPCA